MPPETPSPPPPSFGFIALGALGFLVAFSVLVLAATAHRHARPAGFAAVALGGLVLVLGSHLDRMAALQAGGMPLLAGGAAVVISLLRGKEGE